MNKQQAEEARGRCEAATKGPWRAGMESGRNIDGIFIGKGSDESRVAMVYGLPSHSTREDCRSIRYTVPLANLDFITHARADLPAALDMLERAMGLVQSFHALKPMHNPLCKCTDCKHHWTAEALLREWEGRDG